MQSVNPTNEELFNLINQFQDGTDEDVEVFQDIKDEDGGLTVGVDEGFIEVFEKAYPKANMDECLQTFFAQLVAGFMEEVEKDPESFEKIKENM